MQRYIELDSFTAVGAGEVANLVLANGVRYDEIHLECSDLDHIEYIRLTLNAVEIFRLGYEQIVMMDIYDGLHVLSGGLEPAGKYISLPLALVQAELLDSQLISGLVTGLGDNVVLEVKLKDSAESPKLKAFANVSAHNGVRNVVRRFVKYTVPVAASGEVDFTSIVKGPRILRMFFKSENIDKLEIKQDQRTVYELTSERNNYLLRRAGKELTSDYFIFDSIKRNFPVVDAMPTTFQNLNFRLTIGEGGAQNVEVLVEQLEAIEPRDWRK